MRTGLEDRKFWVETLSRIVNPVLDALAQRKLKATMPVELVRGRESERLPATHLEALSRTTAGIAPWIELGASETGIADANEARTCARLAELARQSIAAAVDPQSPDYMNFTQGRQPIVEAAFLAHGLIRAPRSLCGLLTDETRAHLIRSLQSTRDRKPPFNNWLLFSAMIEAALSMMNQPWDAMRVDYAIRQHMQWYKGDGVYGDGPDFHWDYYNSYVIQPMLLDVLETIGKVSREWDEFTAPIQQRAIRYAAIQERLISPEGAFPPIGRSLAYRMGAFQLLGQMALRHQLPQGIKPAQVRCAMTAVIKRLMEMPGAFDKDGWLTIGLCGHQPGLGETYISTGSLYLCTVGFLPLGLPSDDPFWSDPPADWTSKNIWNGVDLPLDRAIGK